MYYTYTCISTHLLLYWIINPPGENPEDKFNILERIS